MPVRLTVKAHYAVIAMLDLARNGNERAVTLSVISKRQDIPLSYLEQLFMQLKRSGLVRSTKGPGGGYHLNNACHAISVASVIDAVNESVDIMKCGGNKGCQKGQTCLSHYLWQDLNRQIQNFLSGVCLKDLLERKDIQRVFERQRAGMADTVNPLMI